MRTILFSGCGAADRYARALADAGAAPALVVVATTAAGEREPAFLRRLEDLSPDLIVVAGWGRVLRRELFSLARLGAVNVHPSLLPDYRGRHPLFWQLLRGETQSGVTVHRITERVDGGPVLAQRAHPIARGATAASLKSELDDLGAELVTALVRSAIRSGLPAGASPAGEGSYQRPVVSEDGRIDWSERAADVDRRVRASAGIVEAFTSFAQRRLVLLDTDPQSVEAWPAGEAAPPGTIVGARGEALGVMASDGVLATTRWACDGRRRTGAELAALLGIEAGARLGAPPTPLDG